MSDASGCALMNETLTRLREENQKLSDQLKEEMRRGTDKYLGVSSLRQKNGELKERLDKILAVEHQAIEPYTFSEDYEEFIHDLLRMLDEIMEIAGGEKDA